MQAAGDEPGELERTLEHLTAHRLLTRSGGDDTDDPLVDISHESLISGWQRLGDWTDERREAEQVRRRLEAKAAEWVRLGRGNGGLLDEATLPEAERWLGSSDALDLGYESTLPDLMRASRQALEEAEHEREATRHRELAQAQALADEQSRSADRMRRSMMGLVAVLLAAVAAGLFAWTQSQKAQVLATREAAARSESEARRVEAERLANAEVKARTEAVRQRLASIAQLLLIQAPLQQANHLDERSLLLARQGYLFSGGDSGRLRDQAERVLRTLSRIPAFSTILSEGGAMAIALGPDDNTLAASDPIAKELFLWDLSRPGVPPSVLSGHPPQPLRTLAFSPDGNTLLGGGGTGNLLRWDLLNPESEPTVLGQLDGEIASVAFSMDGELIAVGGKRDDTVWLWRSAEMAAGPTIFHVSETVPSSPVPANSAGGVSVAFSPNSKVLASGGLSGIIRLWDPSAPDAPVAVMRGHDDGVWSLAFSADGETLASGSKDSTVRLWDLTEPNRPALILRGHDEPVNEVAFSPAGNSLASGSNDNTIRLWSLSEQGAPPRVLESTESNVYGLAFSADGQRLISATYGKKGLRVFDLTPSGQPTVLWEGSKSVIVLAFSPDGKTLASGHSDGNVRLWDTTDSSTPPIVLSELHGRIFSVAFSPDSKVLASGDEHGIVRIWGLGDPVFPIAVFDENSRFAWSTPFSPDGRILAAGDTNGIIRLWDPTDPSAEPTVLQLATESTLFEVMFSPDGSTLAAATEGSGTIHLRDLASPDVTETVLTGHEGTVWTVAFSPDGAALASGGQDSKVLLWSVRDPDTPPTLVGKHEDLVPRVRFSPNGEHLATAGQDKSVRLWSVAGSEIPPPVLLYAHEKPVWGLAFSPDSKTLATGSDDGTILLWDMTHPMMQLTTEGLANRVCEKVWRNLTLEEWHQFVGEDLPYERTCPNLPIHRSLFETAEKQAKAGDRDEAIALLERTVELDPDLQLNPQKEVERWTTSADQ